MKVGPIEMFLPIIAETLLTRAASLDLVSFSTSGALQRCILQSIVADALQYSRQNYVGSMQLQSPGTILLRCRAQDSMPSVQSF